mmetsp:Transcript_14908/g.16134  ORF Transcript_14908/g.16134 Transcript_14908/m.16134 type:complete len:417 (+) Transcript_14908:58-1308(+)
MDIELGGKQGKQGKLRVPSEDAENLLTTANQSERNSTETIPETNSNYSLESVVPLVKSYGLHILGCIILLLQIIILFRFSQLDSSTTESVNNLNSDVKTLQQALTVESSIYSAYLVNDTIVANIQASALQISQPTKHVISEIVVNQKRVWSAPLMKVYVDDMIEWNWSTNENVISSDSNYVPAASGKRVLDSGPLKSYSTYSHTFLQAGQYYYTSENSQTLAGIVIVLEKDFLLTSNEGAGPVTNFVPKGFLADIKPDYFDSLDGCWEECYDASSKALNLQSPWSDCSGNWIFIGAENNKGFISGAFAKADIFDRSLTDFGSNSYSQYFYPTLENGLYWYSLIYRQPFYFTYGVFETSTNNQPIYVDSYSGYIYCPTRGMSFGSGKMCIDSVTSSDPQSWRRKVFTNTCRLMNPPY